LGGRAQVRGVSGVWKDLTDNVDFSSRISPCASTVIF
jgi:hypothetical protein